VVYEKIAPVHVSGHASQEDQKLLISLIKPKYFVPIHGELRHLTLHARIAQELGIPASNTMVVENGYILEFDRKSGRIGERVPGGYVFVDGALVGDVGPMVMRDREILARDGFVIAVIRLSKKTGEPIGRPEIIGVLSSCPTLRSSSRELGTGSCRSWRRAPKAKWPSGTGCAIPWPNSSTARPSDGR